jgi:DNA-binding CsgD family transcriptional regulator
MLSAREREVAALVLRGKTYSEIGAAIFISPRTAEHHIARIRRRLGATSRSDLLTKLRLALEGATEERGDA